MGIVETINRCFKKIQFALPITVLMGFLIVILLSGCSIKGEETFLVKEHLDETVVKINDHEFTLEDIGYYIANGEASVEAQALTYNPDNPEEYWNKHTNGIFIKVQARQNVMDNFVRDEILAIAAKEQGLTLSDEEKENCKTGAQTMYNQLNAFQKEEAGITVENLKVALENAYLGQNYLKYRLENDGRDDYTEQDWQLNGVCYEGLLNKYKVKVIDSVWEKVDFGKVTIER